MVPSTALSSTTRKTNAALVPWCSWHHVITPCALLILHPHRRKASFYVLSTEFLSLATCLNACCIAHKKHSKHVLSLVQQYELSNMPEDMLHSTQRAQQACAISCTLTALPALQSTFPTCRWLGSLPSLAPTNALLSSHPSPAPSSPTSPAPWQALRASCPSTLQH